MQNKVVIIGTGNVGMSYAYALLSQQEFVNELVLIDKNIADAEGEALDLEDALPFAPTNMKVRRGTYKDCKGAAMVAITAGANQTPGETRMDLAQRNAVIVQDIVTQAMAAGFDGIFLVATNPVDVMTYVAWHTSKLPKHKVVGSGTVLDTARLRYALGQKLRTNPKNLHAYVVGEHGDSEFVAWSSANFSLQKVTEVLDKEGQSKIEDAVKNAAYKIIEKKGATYYGIGMCMARITEAILGDENAVLPVSNFNERGQVFIGMPAAVGRTGVKERLPIELSAREQKYLDRSIDIIKKAVKSVIK
ncbi:MAG: L-lactate dehydrogenase [Candidatus Nomurabacteria bacterium]|jgi:L-lactate dehydrogenase|nr:L-lactate dehydrogenase [Candidatus Nomurabacteria bacterium]